MDGSQFDSLMRVVGRVSTRRTTLRSALSGAAATAAAAVGFSAMAGDVAAKKKCKKKKCPTCEALLFGQPCTSNLQCCTNETNMICAVASNAGNSDKTCCGALGFPCTTNDQCCGDFTCQNGFCTS